MTKFSSGPESPYTALGCLFLSAQSEGDAAKACEAGGEQVRAPEIKTCSIQPNLDNLTYEENYSANQLYWIARTASVRRESMTRENSILSPKLCLLVQCTQTEPFSNMSFQDSGKW